MNVDIQEMVLDFRVNGKEVSIAIDTRETLLDVLRDKVGLTGPKKGCDETACGACTVLLDGEGVCSCTVLAAEASGSTVITVEGIDKTDLGEEIQRAFVENDSFQCGFCTSGQIVSAVSLLNSEKRPLGDNEVREGMSGNICRCGAYTKIVRAISETSRNGGVGIEHHDAE